ncbi:MAG: chromate transporter [Chloroflexota bacterium]|nr:chromate transporter [Dehalococcoidia bacterium]MDW8253259.1 chromate transporter [Chloroflexota bacterium]
MIDFLTLFLVYLKLGVLAIGGAAAVLPEMYREFVVIRGWMTDAEFAHAYAVGQLAPGPNMLMQVYVGYQLGGVGGVLAALLGFFAPTAALCAAFSRWWYGRAGSAWTAALMRALAPVALGLLLSGLWTVGHAAIVDLKTAAIALGAAALLLGWRVNPLLVMALAAVVGYILPG